MPKLLEPRLGLVGAAITFMFATSLCVGQRTEVHSQSGDQVGPSLASFVYPSAAAYGSPAGGSEKFARKYTSADAPEAVVRWYLDSLLAEFGKPRPDGSAQYNPLATGPWVTLNGYASLGQPLLKAPYEQLEMVVNDYRLNTATHDVEEGPLVWTLTAKISQGKLHHVLSVVVGRAHEKQPTHIALSLLPG